MVFLLVVQREAQPIFASLRGRDESHFAGDHRAPRRRLRLERARFPRRAPSL